MKSELKESQRIKRHLRIRKKILGTSERPRLVIHKSEKNLYCQLINDIDQKTLFAFSTQSENFKTVSKKGGTAKAAEALGKLFSGILKTKGFKKVAFDRGGYRYHGRIKALAEALREGGIEF